MRIVSIALKDLSQLARDRKTVLFLLIMPVAFTLFFGLAYRSFTTTGDADDAPVIALARSDAEVPLVDALAESLRTSPTLRLLEVDADADREGLLERGAAHAVVTIPAGLGPDIEPADLLPLDVIAEPTTPTGRAAVTALDTAVQRFLGSVQIADLALSAGRDASGGTETSEPGRAETAWSAALGAARIAWREAPIRVNADRASPSDVPAAIANPYAQASPGMIVQFAIYGLILSAMLLVLERKTGALARLVGTPTPRAAIVAGHVLAMFVVVFLQIAVLVAFGQVALGVDYLAHPLAVLLTSAALALWSASLGLLIGSLSRTEDQVVVGSLLAMFLFSALGGAWFPLEVTGQAFSTIGHLTPGAWAMDAYQSILLRDQGVGGILLPLLVLVGFALLFFAIATWRFEPAT